MALYKLVENDDDYIYLNCRNSVRRRLRLSDFRFEKAYLENGITSTWRWVKPTDLDIEEILRIVRSRLQ